VKPFFVLAILVSGLVVSASALSASSASRVVLTVTPVRPYQPGDAVVTGTSPPPTGYSIQATGCQRVPTSGYLNNGASANTAVEYANHWEWSSGSSSQPYSWWIKKTDGTTVDSGSPASAGGSSDPAANDYYFRIQNRGATPQAWNVCYDVH
jgi:hypothetical protein